MNCMEFSNLLDAYLEGTLPEEQARALEAHAAACPACADLMAAMLDCRQADEEIEVPDSFGASWRQAIREEEAMETPKRKKNGWQKWLAAAAALVVVLGGTALTRNGVPRTAENETPALYAKQGASDAGMLRTAGSALTNFSFDAGADGEYAADTDLLTAPMAASADTQTAKIIKTASVSLKTLSFDDTMDAILELATEYGGRTEYLYQSADGGDGELRRASMTLRIPADQLDDFLSGVQASGQAVSLTQTSEDVSDSYYDVQARLETQHQKLARLQSLMETAENVSDLIDIENAIADAQYNIDRYTWQLNAYDSQVTYSTVEVSLREIRQEESEEIGLGQRIGIGLQRSLSGGADFLEDMAVFAVSAAPWLALAAAGIAIVRLIVKKRHGKDEKK